MLIEETRPGIMALWGNDGHVSHADAKRCIELLGSEVLPALREMSDELGLAGPFEADAPISSRFLEPPRIPAAATA